MKYKPKANVERIKLAIEVMKGIKERGGKLNMARFQAADTYHTYCATATDAIDCGTAACLSGWLAIAPEVQELGYSYDPIYANLISEKLDIDAYSGEHIAEFFGVRYDYRPKNQKYIDGLIAIDTELSEILYGERFREIIKHEQVIRELENWLQYNITHYGKSKKKSEETHA